MIIIICSVVVLERKYCSVIIIYYRCHCPNKEALFSDYYHILSLRKYCSLVIIIICSVTYFPLKHETLRCNQS